MLSVESNGSSRLANVLVASQLAVFVLDVYPGAFRFIVNAKRDLDREPVGLDQGACTQIVDDDKGCLGASD